MTDLAPFHLAFTVDDLAEARRFYGGLIGCAEGRSDDAWVDFDFFGHQIVAHLDPAKTSHLASNPVDGHNVPVPHFGVVLDWNDFHALRGRFEAAGLEWGVEPHIRFAGQPGEQATMFVRDPAGNALEFKSFRNPAQLFAT